MGNKGAIRGYTLDQLCNEFVVFHVFQVKSALGAYKQLAIIDEWDDDCFAIYELCPEMSNPIWFYSEGIEKTDYPNKRDIERRYTSLYPLESVCS